MSHSVQSAPDKSNRGSPDDVFRNAIGLILTNGTEITCPFEIVIWLSCEFGADWILVTLSSSELAEFNHSAVKRKSVNDLTIDSSFFKCDFLSINFRLESICRLSAALRQTPIAKLRGLHRSLPTYIKIGNALFRAF